MGALVAPPLREPRLAPTAFESDSQAGRTLDFGFPAPHPLLRACIVVPARNEQAILPAVIGALAVQRDFWAEPRYASALELGCSIGVFTRLLAPRCDVLLATDVSAVALARARERCADQPHVRCAQRELPAQFPRGTFDLILVSEVGYYFSAPDLEILRSKISAALAPGGHLLLVHFTGQTHYPLSAEVIHAAFLAWPEGA